ncbi:MAG: site-specific DNA-methyltransferase [Chloroflexota bacterium]|nr:site-specific DNA-methyltransferase [Chloroflexota bacterium]
MSGIELRWANKDRVLYQVPQRGTDNKPIYYGDPGTPVWPDHRPLLRCATYGTPDGSEPNRLIQGDNLIALQALIDEGWSSRIKCVYIDPPFNTGTAFAHYDDGFENTIWLGLMRDRLKLLHKLLDDEQGSLWLELDEKMIAHARLILDEIFGPHNFVNMVVWQKKYSPSNDARYLSDNADFIAVYAKNKATWHRNLLCRTEAMDERYKNPDNDPRGPWSSGGLDVKTPNQRDVYPIRTPNGGEVWPPKGTSWRYSKERFAELVADNRIWFPPKGKQVPRYKRFLSEVQPGFVPLTLWLRHEVGDSQEAKKEVKALLPDVEDVFTTPKPERLMRRIIEIATAEGDWVLDSFAGSATTAAVAYQMGRRFITIETGEHAQTHCLPRLEKVRMGAEPYERAIGGGFVFEEVGPPLVVHDPLLGIDRLNPVYKNGQYQRAVCLLTGFKHQPDDTILHGRAGGTDSKRFCHIAERGVLVTKEYIEPISQLLHSMEHANGHDLATCVVYATKMTSDLGCFSNVEVVRIPAGFANIRSEKEGNK